MKWTGLTGWGFRVDREGNLHDAFPRPKAKKPAWPRTGWRVRPRGLKTRRAGHGFQLKRFAPQHP